MRLLPPPLEGVELNCPHETSTTYELYAVVSHYGDKAEEGLASGHCQLARFQQSLSLRALIIWD